MPVTFEQPQPLAPQISEGYGQTQQFNQTLPTLANLYNQRAARDQQAAQFAIQQASQAQAQTAHNREAAYQQDNQTENLFESQRRNAEIQQHLQDQHFQQQAALQQQAAFNEQAFAGVKVGLQEQMKMQERTRGLTEIQGKIADGTLDEKDPAVIDAISELKTGINFTQRRMMQEHAADFKAQSDLRSQQTANIAKDNAHMEKFEADRINAGYGTLSFHDQNGRMHVLLKNPKTGEWYNPLLEHNKAGADAEAKQQETDLKTWEARYQHYQKIVSEVQKRVDTMSKENGGWGPDKIDEEMRIGLQKRNAVDPGPPPTRQGGQSLGQPAPPTGQTAPPNTPGQDAQVQNDQRDIPTSKVPAYDSEINAIKNSPYNDEQKQQATGIVQGIREILAKGNKMTAEDRRNLVTFQGLLKSYQAIKWE